MGVGLHWTRLHAHSRPAAGQLVGAQQRAAGNASCEQVKSLGSDEPEATHEHAAPGASASSLHVVALVACKGWHSPAQPRAMQARSASLAAAGVAPAVGASCVQVWSFFEAQLSRMPSVSAQESALQHALTSS